MNTTVNKHVVLILTALSMALGLSASDLELGWTGESMSADGSTIRTDGDVVFAYCRNGGTSDNDGGEFTVNGVTFAGLGDFRKNKTGYSSDMEAYRDDSETSPIVNDEQYQVVLCNSWWINKNGFSFTLKNLTPGNRYLFQLVTCRNNQSSSVLCAPGEGSCSVQAGGDGWAYGGTLVGIFDAGAESMTFTFNCQGRGHLNAFQLRDLGKGGPVVLDPSVGSASVVPVGAVASITLDDVSLGTDTQGEWATSYSVYYSLDGGDAVEALAGQSSSSVMFAIEGLADGNHTCDVWIETDKGKETAPKTVAFRINTRVGDYDMIKARIEAAQQGDTVYVPAGLYQATSKINVANKQVKVIADGNVVINGEYCTEGVFNIGRSGAVISGIEFENCTNPDGYGGAVNLNNNYHGFVATNCVFRNCSAKMGGAIGGSLYYGEYGAESSDGIPARGELGVITGCTFVDCASTGTGAGTGDSGGGSVEGAFWVENSTFEGGASNYYAPGIYSGFNLMVTNCTFSKIGPASINNTRRIVFMARGNTELCVKDCRFVDTTCQPILGVQSNRMLVDRCEFRNCTGSETKPNDMSGNMEFSFGRGTVRDSLFCDNMNPLALGNQVFENCSIVGNVGGFFIKINSGSPSPAFTNCVWAKNTKWEGSGYTSYGGPGLCWHSGEPDAYENLSIRSCAFEGASTAEAMRVLFTRDASGATEAISTAVDVKGPKFNNPENGDWTLKGNSPLRNAGVYLDWMTGAYDLAGKPRAKDGAVDLGCYERISMGFTVSIR